MQSLCLLQSLDGDTLSVIENPAAVSHPFHQQKTEVGGAREAKVYHAWLKWIPNTNHGKTPVVH